MEIITSKSNQKIIDAKKLFDKKERDRSSTFLVETKKVIMEAIKSKYIANCFFVENGKNFDFLQNEKAPIYMVSSDVFRALSNVVSPDGIVAIFQKKSQAKSLPSGNFLILDNLQNPDNFGAIVRTALACNFTKIYVLNCVDEFSPKVLRASMGNVLNINIEHISFDDIDKLFANSTLFACSMEGKNILDFQNFDTNSGFVIGNEGSGISEELKYKIKNTIAIPMENNVESLNASVSASIVMFYIYSKNFKKQ